jgi:hypothetical protein
MWSNYNNLYLFPILLPRARGHFIEQAIISKIYDYKRQLALLLLPPLPGAESARRLIWPFARHDGRSVSQSGRQAAGH